MKVGDEKIIIVPPEEAYGQPTPDALTEIPKENIGNPNPQVGAELRAELQPGTVISAVITEVKKDTIVIDLNHPLAGKELHFEVKIVEIK